MAYWRIVRSLYQSSKRNKKILLENSFEKLNNLSSIPQLDERQIELPQSREEKKTKSKSPSPRRLKLAYFNFVPGGELRPSGRSSFEKWNHVESEFKSGRRSAVVNVQERQLIRNGWDPRQRFQHKVGLCIV
ncbi:hypothetical protein T07_980 [Trichinella nelsoni]|uniref:Uncharacterized protein n=1 Tax=Trichinella nelsoni TaxID=6336 RepID=A0A0V0S275_9BILA|nr:hypothetical protein T07_980 [Trichinella nelsoni]